MAFMSREDTTRLRDRFLSKVRDKVCLRDCFFSKVRDENSGTITLLWYGDALNEVMSYLIGLAPHIGDISVVLFSNVDKYIGAVSLPVQRVLRNAKAVWEFVDEDLCVTTADGRNGLCVEFNFYTPEGRYVSEGVYEITAWGTFAREIET
jgi:hypothetical protein